MPSPCVVQEIHGHQTSKNNSEKDCPTFFVATLIGLGNLDHFIEQHDKSIVAGFTVVLAISTIGLWLSTARLQETTNALWTAGERQLELTRISAEAAQKSAEVAERAFSHARKPAFAFSSKTGFQNIEIGKRPSLAISFQNIGRGEAHDVNYVLHSGVLPIEQLSEPFRVTKPDHGHYVVVPGESLVRTATFANDLSAQNVNDIKSGKAAFCVWGAIVYSGDDDNDASGFSYSYIAGDGEFGKYTVEIEDPEDKDG